MARAAGTWRVLAVDMVTPMQRRVRTDPALFFGMAINKRTSGSKNQNTKAAEDQLAGRIQSLLEKFEYQTNDSNFKISVGDYIRLIPLKNELEGNQPHDIEVRWVEQEVAGTQESEQ